MQSFSVVLATVYTVGCKDWKYNIIACPPSVEQTKMIAAIICMLFAMVSSCYSQSLTIPCAEIAQNDPSYVPPIRLSVKCNSTHSILAVSKLESDSLDYLQLEYTCSNMTSNVTKIIHENIVNHLDDGGMTFVERQNGNWQCEWRGCIEERERLTWYHIEAQNECISSSVTAPATVSLQSSGLNTIDEESITIKATATSSHSQSQVPFFNSSSSSTDITLSVTPTSILSPEDGSQESSNQSNEETFYFAIVAAVVLLIAIGSIGLLIITLMLIKIKLKRWNGQKVVCDLWQDEAFDLSIVALSASPSLVTVYCDQHTNLKAQKAINDEEQLATIKNSYPTEPQVV